MKDFIIRRLEERIQDELTARDQIKILKETHSRLWFDSALDNLYLYSRPRENQPYPYFSAIATTIGKSILKKMKKSINSGVAVKIGAFVLYTFEEFEITKLEKERGVKHKTYFLKVIDEDTLYELWRTIPKHEMEKLPSLVPYEDWVSFTHPRNREKLVKSNNDFVSSEIFNCTMAFETINKAQRLGRVVNEKVLNIAKWALNNKAEAFSDIWEQSHEARKTKTREAKTIIDIAEMYIDNVFYYQYFFDFR